MKKLGKLEINSEKIMKNEELIALRGGYDQGPCQCICATYNPDVGICGTAYAAQGELCNDVCVDAPGCEGGTHTWGECM